MNFSSLEKEMFRVKTSFAHQKDDLLAEVRDRNDKIFAFLQQASHLSDTRTIPLPRPARDQMSPLLALQDDASALYETFQAHLRCKCTSDHSCGIAVSTPDGLRDQVAAGHLKMLFWEGPCRTQVKILSMSATDLKTIAPSKSSTDRLEEVSSLHQQLSTRNRFESVRKRAPKAIFALAASSIPAFGRLTIEKSRKALAKQRDQPKMPPRIQRFSTISEKYVAIVDHVTCFAIIHFLPSTADFVPVKRSRERVFEPTETNIK